MAERACETCGLVYDDVYRWTFCPHDEFVMRTTLVRPDGSTVVCTSVEQLDAEMRAITDAQVPRWETADGFVRAVCEPDGYCKDGHRCGKLDLGIVDG